MKKLPFVSIVTVNYNGRKFLKDCFDSLYRLNYPKSRFEIFMVDNGSKDRSVEFVRQKYRKVKIIYNDVNNYARANNLGIKSSNGKYVALINNDTKVDPDWLMELIEVIDSDKSIGAAGSKILFMDGRIYSTAHQEFPNYYWGDRGFKEEDFGQFDFIEEIKSICGCSIIFRKDCFKKIGLLDEYFNMFMEDLDVSIRLKKAGWKLAYVPKSKIYHTFHGTVDEERVNFYCERNRLLLLAKHYPEKIGDALFGKGYFTTLSDIEKRRDLSIIIPDVLRVLSKHHKEEDVKKIMPPIFENVRKIYNFEKSSLLRILDERRNQLLEKESFLRERDKQLQLKDNALLERNERLRELDFTLQERDDRLRERDNRLRESDSILKGRDKLIQEQVIYLKEKDRLIQEKAALIKQMHSEQHLEQELIKRFEEEKIAFYDSETFRFIVGPIWRLFDLLKNKRYKFLKIIGKLNFLNQKNKSLCFAYFSSDKPSARLNETNKYHLKISNDSETTQLIKALIKVEDINKKGVCHKSFIKDFSVEPKDSTEVEIEYDWRENANFRFNGSVLKASLLNNSNIPTEQFYSVVAVLQDSQERELDRLNIFQRFEA